MVFLSFCGDLIGVSLSVPTFGASMVLSPTARGLAGSIVGGLGGGDDSDTKNLLEQQKLQNEQFKTQLEERKAEIERLRKEREEFNQKVKQNNEEIDRLRLIVNDPNKSDEERKRARSRIAILEDENNRLRGDILVIGDKIKKKEDEDIKPATNPFGSSLPKLSRYDKFLIAGVMVLIIYFLFLRENKSK